MGRTIGYIWVSTVEQDLSLPLDALRQAGCAEEHIFLDVASGLYTAHPGLEACLQSVTAGDTLVVWRLDRLGRSMLHLVTVMTDLGQRQVGFRSLCDGALDTTTATRLIFSSLRGSGERAPPAERCQACVRLNRASPKSVHRRFIHSMLWTHRYCALTRATSVPMLCGLI
jgi:DNA invertase Pin-like site-specific DNA recombinase